MRSILSLAAILAVVLFVGCGEEVVNDPSDPAGTNNINPSPNNNTDNPDPETKTASLIVEANIAGANIFINNEMQNAVTPASFELPLGTYTVKATLENYIVIPDLTEIDLDEDGAEVEFNLEEQEPAEDVCENLRVIEGLWYNVEDGDEATVELTPLEDTCSVYFYGRGLGGTNLTIIGTELPLEQGNETRSVRMQLLDNGYLEQSFTGADHLRNSILHR